MEKDEKQLQPEPQNKQNTRKSNKLLSLLKTKKGKITAATVVVVLILATLLFVPAVRNVSIGLLVKKQVSVKVVDSISSQPISDAKVSIDGSEGTTNTEGVASINSVSAVAHTIVVSKPNYKSSSASVEIPFFTNPSEYEVKVEATGQQVVLTLTNAITTAPLADADIAFDDATSKTDQDGKATIVLPYKEEEQSGTVKKAGFEGKTLQVTTKAGVAEQSLGTSLTPSGTVMYLSKKTGNIDVMRANLDGTNAKILVKGTGSELDGETVLLSTRDWKYAVLLAQRDGAKQKLYLIEKSTGKLTLIDEGNVDFTLSGWSGNRFVYQIFRGDKKAWDSKRSAIKIYDADSKTLHTADETSAFRKGSNYGQETYVGTYVLDNEIVFATSWYFGNVYGYGYYGNDKRNGRLVSLNPSSLTKNTIQNFSIDDSDTLDLKAYEAQAVYLQYTKDYDYDKAKYYEYENKKIALKSDLSSAKYNKPYPTYLISPTGKKTFWYDERDGKNVLFVGDKFGKNSKVVSERSEYKPYGWFGSGDEYVLVSKEDSELYVASTDKLNDPNYQPVKVTNYHKPRTSYYGYGYGYGGV